MKKDAFNLLQVLGPEKASDSAPTEPHSNWQPPCSQRRKDGAAHIEHPAGSPLPGEWALLPCRKGGRVRLAWRQGLWAGPPGRGTRGLRSEPWSTGPHLDHSQDTGAITFEKTASVYSEWPWGSCRQQVQIIYINTGLGNIFTASDTAQKTEWTVVG